MLSGIFLFLLSLTRPHAFFLASQGGNKGALSALVQNAVSLYILASLSGEAKRKMLDSGLSQAELNKIIAEGIEWAKGQPK